MLTHHLCLGVAMAGVEAVGAAGHRLTRPHRGEAELRERDCDCLMLKLLREPINLNVGSIWNSGNEAYRPAYIY